MDIFMLMQNVIKEVVMLTVKTPWAFTNLLRYLHL